MAVTGFKTTFSVNDGGSNAQQLFSNVANVTIPYGKVNVLPFSTLAQTTRDLEKVPAMTDNGQVSFSFYWNKADFARLIALKGRKYYGTTTATAVTWVINSPDEDGTTATLTPQKCTFAGILVEAETEMANDGIAMIKGKIEVSGAITFADGTNDA
jgi:hypothetical protein